VAVREAPAGNTPVVEHDGNGWVRCLRGHRHWGRFGAAGLLLVDSRADGRTSILLQHRAARTADGDTWGVPGGARDSHESAVQAALRETGEEAGIWQGAMRVYGEFVDDHGGGWSYTTVMADLVADVTLVVQAESLELRWVELDLVEDLTLLPGFARTWPLLRERVAHRLGTSGA
jgi:8-oxo-dGTP diphosphatase